MFRPTREEFKEKVKQGNLIPVYAEVFADLETPVSAFLKLRRGKFNFLLESVEGGNQIGRYSFLGRDPGLLFEARGNLVKIRRGAEVESITTANPLEELKRLIRELKPVIDPDLPPFTGGAVGYLGYDVVRQFDPEFVARCGSLKVLRVLAEVAGEDEIADRDALDTHAH